MAKLVDDRGFFWWGWHRHYDAYLDQITGHSGNHHEIHVQDIIRGHACKPYYEAIDGVGYLLLALSELDVAVGEQ
jgi:hypothetical protein